MMHIFTINHITTILNGGHFEKWLPRLSWLKFQRAQYPNLLRIYQSTCVPNLVLLDKTEQLVWYVWLCRWTMYISQGFYFREFCESGAIREINNTLLKIFIPIPLSLAFLLYWFPDREFIYVREKYTVYSISMQHTLGVRYHCLVCDKVNNLLWTCNCTYVYFSKLPSS